jgi:hypothetical protein
MICVPYVAPVRMPDGNPLVILFDWLEGALE